MGSFAIRRSATLAPSTLTTTRSPPEDPTVSRCSLIVLCAALTACQSPLVSVPANDAEGVGIASALPRQLVKLTVVRSDKTTRKQYIETLKGQKAAAEKALEPIDTSIGALMKLRGSLAGATGPKAKEAVKTIDARVEALSAVMAAKKAEIDGKAAEIETLSQDAKADCVDSISLALLPPEPDPNHRYVATLGHSIFRDDKWLITTTPEGLLSSADTVIADRSADVVVELARSAALVAKAITMVPLIAEGPTTEEGEEEECIPFRNEHIFDPDTSIDPNSPLNWAKANETLRRWGLNTTTVTPKPERQFSNTQWPSAPHGLHYRRPIPYTIEIEIGGASCGVGV